jgi:4'-phosphopantetheinyl transferase
MIELWLVDLEQAAPSLEALERAAPRLSPDDRARARALADPRERRHRLAAYAALRVAIERIAGPQVRGVGFACSPGGKPRLPGEDQVGFSLSHSNGLALIGVTRRGDIGVDLECERRVRISTRRAQLIVAAARGIAPTLGKPAFLQAWARLEAFAKAHGRGLARLLADIGVRGNDRHAISPARVEAAARRILEEARLEVHDLVLLTGLYGATATEPSRTTTPPKVRNFPVGSRDIERLLAPRTASRRRR